jgi:hypothetical protein
MVLYIFYPAAREAKINLPLGILTIEGTERGRERLKVHRVIINIDWRRRNILWLLPEGLGA